MLKAWLDELAFRWQTSDRSQLGFASMLLLPCAAIFAIVFFARADHVERQADAERGRELGCLAENVYHEARGEPRAGQVAVAEVVLNRVAASGFPGTICEVVHEKHLDVTRRRYVGAFSWTEIDELRRPRGRAWRRAVEIATAVYEGEEPAVVPGATHYHSTAVEPPWAAQKRQVATIGNHIFYR